MKEIRKSWKLLVGMFLFAVGIMVNGSVETFAENKFITIKDVDNPKEFKGQFVVGDNRYYTYKVTATETGIYSITGKATFSNSSYDYPLLRIYAYNASKQAMSINAGVGDKTDVIVTNAKIYMVKGKTYYIGFWVQHLNGQSVEVTMSKTDLVAQPKMEYKVTFYPNRGTADQYVNGNYNWDSENATLTFDNCEIGPCEVIFSAINSDKPNGENYYFAVDDFPNIKDIKVVFKGENKYSCYMNSSNSSSPLFHIFEGCGNTDFVNVGIEFTGGGTVNIDEEYPPVFISTVGDVRFDNITINAVWDNLAIWGRRNFYTESNLTLSDTVINCMLERFDDSTVLNAAGNIVVDNSYIIINADLGRESDRPHFSGVFDADVNVLLNSGGLYVVAESEYLELLEKNMYGSYSMNAEQIKVDKDNFIILSGKKLDISKIKYSLEKAPCIYDGKPQTPKVIIAGLKEGVDYEVEYSDNVNIGTAKFKVIGIGRFEGTIEGTFEIAEKSVENQAGEDKDVNTETTLTDGKLIYKILKDASADGKKAGKVKVIGLKKKNLKKITVKSVVKFNGKKYKVTSIAANAFKGNRKITKVTIGKNLRSIGKKAFFGCKKLKSVKIKSKKLKVGKKAFYRKGGKKLTIKVPKKLKKKYKKAFKKAKTNKYVVK